MEIIRQVVISRVNSLINSKNKDYESLFNIIHNQDDRIFAEYTENFKLKEVPYKDMKSYVYKMASFLNEKIKLNTDSFVGIYFENSVNFIAIFWAVLMIGYKPLLINCRLPENINNDVLKMTNCNFVIKDSKLSFKTEAKTLELENQNGFFEEVVGKEEFKPSKWGNEIALTTTATTMNCKVCVYTGENMFYEALNTKFILSKNKRVKKHYKHRMKFLCFLPFYHVFGLFACYIWFSIFGRTFVFLKDYSSTTILNTIKKHEITHIFSVPMFWNTIAREIKKEVKNLGDKYEKKFNMGIKLSLFVQKIFPTIGIEISKKIFRPIVSRTLGKSVLFCISGGGYISSDTLTLMNSLGYYLCNGYGSTELGITSFQLKKQIKHRISPSIGQPFESITYKIENDHLLVTGDSICKKIIYKDGETKTMGVNEFYDTNDLAINENNSYFLLGRADDVALNSNGEKINPDVVEQNISLLSVSNYCVIGIEGKLSFIFQIREDENPLNILNIKNEINDMLKTLKEKGYCFDQVLFTYDQLLIGNSIKVSRQVIKKLLDENKLTLHPYSELKIDVAEPKVIDKALATRVGKIVSEVLDKEVKENDYDKHLIFDLGGTSLDYCTIMMKLEDEFNLKFGQSDFSNINQFADYLKKIFDKTMEKEGN